MRFFSVFFTLLLQALHSCSVEGFQSRTAVLDNNALPIKGHRNVKNVIVGSEWRHNVHIFKPKKSALSATIPSLERFIEPVLDKAPGDSIAQAMYDSNALASHSTLMFHQLGSRVLLCMDGEVAATIEQASSGTATWRQYVVLAVILAVIVDILLGSPLAGAVAAPLRQQAEDIQEQEVKKNSPMDASRERVDSEAMAKQVLDRVYGAQELEDYLERNKSDKDRMEEMRQKIDKQFRDMS